MRPHHTKNKGDFAVLKSQVDLHSKGYSILTPQSEHEPFDLVAYKEGKFLRVQVKYREVKNGKITVNFSTSWADKNGAHTQPYDKNEIDLFCIYCPDTDMCYYLNPNRFNKHVCLRVNNPKGHFQKNMNMASDFTEVPPLDY
jgi:hypothetical protein